MTSSTFGEPTPPTRTSDLDPKTLNLIKLEDQHNSK